MIPNMSALFLLLASSCLAAPALEPAPPSTTDAPNLDDAIVARDVASAIDLIQGEFKGISSEFSSDIHTDVTQVITAYANIITGASTSFAKPAPTDPVELRDRVSSILAPNPSNVANSINIVVDAAELVVNNIKPKDNSGIIGETAGSAQSFNNYNPINPRKACHPIKATGDAPYSVSEKDLRAGIHIPAGFTYGQRLPVILVPGTGSTGGGTFAGNMIPLLSGDSRFDLVYVNVPGYMLADAQINAEYTAYAINYIAGITNRNVSVVSWSQGGLSTQWALKYWPSTRHVVSDFVPISPDFHGTVNADFLCFNNHILPCDPSIIQQGYNSNFVKQLRLNNGDSAFVPTTTVYSSIFDEIVEPQTGGSASAYMKDVRGVGVTNNEVQAVCSGKLGGSYYSHELTLASPIAYGLVIDALTHDGPGQVSRLDLGTLCNLYLAPGLSVADGIATQADLVQAALNLVLYLPKLATEPPLQAYAYSH